MAVMPRTTRTGERRYDARVRTPDGRVLTRTFRRKKDAEAWESQQLADRARGTWLDPRRSAMTVAEWATSWLSRPGKRATTRATDGSALRTHILPALGARKLGSVTPLDVQELVNRWSVRMAPATVKRVYGVLVTVFRAAVEADLLHRTPCRGIALPAIVQRRRRVLTPAEVHRLVGATEPRYAPLVLIAAVLGLRWGEAAGVRIGDLDFAGGTVTVSGAVARGEHGEPVLSEPKSVAGRRTMAAPPSLMAILASHLGNETDPDALVFPAPGGGLLAYQNFLNRIWLPAVAQAGLAGVRFHDLRRGAATVMTRITDVKTLQSRLGHVDPRLSIGLYAQFTSVADQAAAAALETLYFARDARAIDPQPPSPDASQAGCETRPDLQEDLVEVMGLEPTTSTLRT
jgi:integrase